MAEREKYKASYGVAEAAEGLKADIEKGKERADRASRLVASRDAGALSTEASVFSLVQRYCRLRDAVDVLFTMDLVARSNDGSYVK